MKGHKFELDKTCGGSLDVPFNDVGGLGIEVDETVLEKYHVPLVHTGVVEAWVCQNTKYFEYSYFSTDFSSCKYSI